MISKMIAIVASIIFMLHITNGQMIRKEFEAIRSKPGMEGIIDECSKSSGIKVEELKDYKTVDDVSDNEFKFYFCFYQKIGFLSEEGKINVEALKELPADDRKTSGINDEMIECLGKLDNIKEPGDMKKLSTCYA